MPRREDITLETLYLPVRELGQKLRIGAFTSEALSRAYIERLEKLGPKLGAVVTVLREQGLAEARQADAERAAGKVRGPLHGIPYGVKDLLATRGVPTTWGARPYRDQVFDYDATVVRKLRAAGAVLIAKLAMIELAGGFGYNRADASFTGPCRTPWNLDYWAGGSSSGSGAAVAAALVPFAIGSETSGSIITPASYCGINGLRPTYGRVSRHGAMALCWTLDKLGPMCRSADDCGLVLAAMAGKDPRDPSSAARTFVPPEGNISRRFKIGIVSRATTNVMPEVRKNFQATVKVLGTFADLVEDVTLPDLPYSDAIGLIVRAEGASAFRELIESGRASELQAPEDRTGGYAMSMVLAVDYLQALRARVPMKQQMDALYARYDAIIAPGRGTVSYPIDRPFGGVYRPNVLGPASGLLISAGNAVGQPALCIPNGFGTRGMPTSVQLTGKAWSEATLLAIAREYQTRTDWQRRQPPEPA